MDSFLGVHTKSGCGGYDVGQGISPPTGTACFKMFAS